MKTNKIYTIPLLLASSVAFPIGMGEIKVDSFINQPFSAEIPLLDIGNNQLSAIQASLATPDEYERIGLVPDELLPFLKFEVTKNQNGQPVIRISSTDRITEPYLRILVDLAWPKGEIYRTYTVLLDPPGYKLGVAKNYGIQKSWPKHANTNQKNVYVDTTSTSATPEYQAKAIVYGPTLVNENIWQISQRYLSSGATLQQIILAIVGTNSQAFTQGNLNGLKIGERLRIPSKEEVLKVPVELARQEVDAHDLAWKSRQEIRHVLLPPYVDGVAGVSQFKPADGEDDDSLDSIIPQAPQFKNSAQELTVALSGVPLIPAGSFQSEKDTSIVISYIPSVTDIQTNSAKSPANLAVNTEGMALKKQLQDLKVKNNQLEKELMHQNKEIKSTALQIKPADKGQPSQMSLTTVPDNSSSHSWLYLLLIAGLAGGGAFVYRMRSKPSQDVPSDNQVFKSMIAPPSIGGHDKIIPEIPVETSEESSGDSAEAPDIGALSVNNTVENAIRNRDEPIDTSLQIPVEEAQEDDHSLQVVEEAQEDEHSLQAPVEEVQEADHSLQAPVEEVQEDDHSLQEENNKESAGDNILEFESGLDKFISGDTKSDASIVANEQEDKGMAFETVDMPVSTQPVDEIHELSAEQPDEPALEPQPDLQVNTGQTDFADNEMPEPEDNTLEFTFETDESPESSDNEIENLLDEKDEALVFESLQLDNEEQIDSIENNQEDGHLSEQNLENTSPKLIKSKAAMDTQLALAKTYISMEDYESARQSLNELLTFGDESQKEEAQKLIDGIADK